MTRLPAVAAALFLACLPATAAADVVELSAPGVEYIDAAAVNDSGEVVGSASFGAGNPDTTRRAYRWQGGFTDLGVVGPCCVNTTPGGFRASGATDINNGGVVVGSSTTSDPCFTSRGVVWVGGAPTTLIDGFGAPKQDATCPTVKQSLATSVNDSGLVAGTSPGFACGVNARGTGFLAQPGSSTPVAIPTGCGQGSTRSDIGDDQAWDINSAGDVLLYMTRTNVESAGLYSAATGAVTSLTLKPSPQHGLNDSGVVVGRAVGAQTGVRYENGAYIPLPPLPGHSQSYASAVSNTGLAVGWSAGGPGGNVATFWEGSTAVDLNTLAPADAGFKLGTAHDISDDGRYVVGEIQGSGQKARSYRLELEEPFTGEPRERRDRRERHIRPEAQAGEPRRRDG